MSSPKLIPGKLEAAILYILHALGPMEIERLVALLEITEAEHIKQTGKSMFYQESE